MTFKIVYCDLPNNKSKEGILWAVALHCIVQHKEIQLGCYDMENTRGNQKDCQKPLHY